MTHPLFVTMSRSNFPPAYVLRQVPQLISTSIYVGFWSVPFLSLGYLTVAVSFASILGQRAPHRFFFSIRRCSNCEWPSHARDLIDLAYLSQRFILIRRGSLKHPALGIARVWLLTPSCGSKMTNGAVAVTNRVPQAYARLVRSCRHSSLAGHGV